MEQVVAQLMEAKVGEVQTNVPLANFTTWKIGGPADIFIIPDGKEGLVKTLGILKRHGIPWMQLGRGSNLLISDKGIRGAVIKLKQGFDHLYFDGEHVRVGAAYSFIVLSVRAAKQGLTGLEFAGGIPGTVGGAVYMNAGAHGSDVSRIIQSAEVVTDEGELVQLDKEDLQYAYRHSVLQEKRGIVTEAFFKLAYGDRKEIAAAMASNKERRLKTQPLQMAVAGSVFRNPEGHHAAKLIEDAGLKGMRVGNAEVSKLHANFIINTGNATAEDVITLMERIQHKIADTYDVRLVPEVLFMGER